MDVGSKFNSLHASSVHTANGPRKLATSMDNTRTIAFDKVKVGKKKEVNNFVTDALADLQVHTSKPGYRRRHASSVMDMSEE